MNSIDKRILTAPKHTLLGGFFFAFTIIAMYFNDEMG